MRDAEGTSVPASFWVNALRRNVILILVFGVLGAVAGIGFSIYQGQEYVSKAAILIEPLQGNPYEPDSKGDQLVNLETEATLVRTDPVAKLAGAKLPGDQEADELLGQVDVEVPNNTQVLEISATSKERTEARDVAQAFADAYLTYRQQRADSSVKKQLQRISRQQEGTRAQVSQANSELQSEDVTESRKAYLEERINNLNAQLAALESQQSTISATDLTPGQVITPAPLPPGAGVLNFVLFGGAGAFAALFVGFAFAVARTRLDTRIHESPEVERLGVTVLGSVGNRFGGHGGGGRAPDLSEIYREIRTAIVTSLDSPPVGLTVASADADADASPEAAALAVGLARSGFTVALVDTIGEPTRLLSDRLRLPGLTELLTEQADLQSLLFQPEERLSVLAPGAPDGQTMDRLLSPRMRHTLAQLSEWNDYVIIAGGHAHSADGQALASLTGAVLLVVARHQTRLNDFIECLDVLDRVDAACIGAVLVGAGSGPRRRSSASDSAGSRLPTDGRYDRARDEAALGSVPRRNGRPGTPAEGTRATPAPRRPARRTGAAAPWATPGQGEDLR
jgi:polysaccharide biosynthesis transport protein